MKLFTKTFGCQMNFADSDEITRHFFERGFKNSTTEEQADAMLVNTCTVRDMAEHKAMSFIGRLKEWKDERPDRLVVVTGCAAERAKDDFKKRFPFIDLIVGAKDIEAFPQELDAFMEARVSAEEALVPQDFTNAFPNEVIQYVTIMRGCNYSCSYCIVPAVRGRERYRPSEDIIKEIAERVNAGAKEVWLLGQTVNSYRPSNKPDYAFPELIRDVAAVPGLERLRFISPHPYYLNENLVRALKDSKPVCEHIHLPVQSGSNEMLKKMRRNYTKEIYLDGVRALRAAIPSIAISTDIIVGFPGETEEQFQETLQLVKDARFASAYCFKYSPRPGTASAEWADDVPEDVKDRRVNELLALTDSQGVEEAARLVGTQQEVLIEQEKDEGVVRGKTRTAWRVRFKANGRKLGDLVQVRITGSHSRELHGELIS